MIDFRRQNRVNDLHTRFDRVASLLKAFRIASMFSDETLFDDEPHLPTDDHDGLSFTEREHVLLCLEEELREAQRELQHVIPYRDILALLKQQEQYVAAFRTEFGTPTGERGEGQPDGAVAAQTHTQGPVAE